MYGETRNKTIRFAQIRGSGNAPKRTILLFRVNNAVFHFVFAAEFSSHYTPLVHSYEIFKPVRMFNSPVWTRVQGTTARARGRAFVRNNIEAVVGGDTATS